jgi:hypothetical protein
MRWLGVVILIAGLSSALAHAQSAAAPADAAPLAPGIAPVPYAPAPYYGYGYPAPDPGRALALNELQSLDIRIAQLKQSQKQHSIVGPTIMTAAGYTVMLVFGAIALSDWAIAENVQHGDCQGGVYDYDPACDVNDDGYIDKDDEDTARTLARTFGALSIVGTGLGITGTVLLVKRLAKRREFAPELRELGLRRGQLLQQLRYGGAYSQRGMQLTLSARF